MSKKKYLRKNPTNYYFDWIPLISFFSISIYLLKRNLNNINHKQSSAVIGVRA
jgi:hypothetical protein